ncbi:metallophosphoesterase [Ureibacillus manganicus]|uniref:Phosphoesterase n=1 Tax=Ureibacillus manganicus DSM 26584 TaxID=1384049 RepID=A0A0A3ILH8_9BACL|nr:metallophosphoesterase [Ureibacillus manganicus]KGR75687.1 phosphoesterase [Ureibacillus manganicus DSM 26584]
MKKLLLLIILIVGAYLFLYINNHWIVTTEHVFESEKVPENFDGFRITQISDLHDALFGENQEHLVEKVRETYPDVIFLTGDVIDSNRYDLEQSLTAVREFVKIADVYYVIGNHEVASNKIDEIYDAMKQLGVKILPNVSTTINQNGESIELIGIEDPLNGHETQWMLDLAREKTNGSTLQILLAHRPEFFKTYVRNDMDMVFSGHAHGGQVRIPFVGGLVAPGQGFLPTYTAGAYKEADTTMFVSRGLGNSTVPFRILNLPEIVVVELRAK